MLDCGDSDGMDNIKGEAELGYLTDAFLLSNHVFEAIQEEIADPRQSCVRSYAQVRQVLSDIAKIVAGQNCGQRVTNLQIQLSVLRVPLKCISPLQAIHDMLAEQTGELVNEQTSDLVNFPPASPGDIEMWKCIPAKGREALYSALRTASEEHELDSEEHELDSQEMAGWVEHFLRLLGSNVSVFFSSDGQGQGPREQSEEVFQTHVHVLGAHGTNFTEEQRRELLDSASQIMSHLGICAHFGFVLAGSLWIVIGTLTPLPDTQQRDLARRLNTYVQECKSGKYGPTSASTWMSAKAVQLTNSALVPFSVLNCVCLARDLQKRSRKRPTATDAGWWTWLDVNGLKTMVAAVLPSSRHQVVRVFQHGQELEGCELLRSAGGIHITTEAKWEDLTWPAALEERMHKISLISQRKEGKEMPWAQRKGFQDFALAVHGLCSSADAVLSQLCMEGLQDVLQSDKVINNCTNPLALLTEAPGPWFCFNLSKTFQRDAMIKYV